jgi:HK97 family phage portal protein
MKKLNFFERLLIIANQSSFDKYVLDFLDGNDVPQTVVVSSEDNAMAFSAVFACFRVLAETFASVPVFEYKKLSNGDRIQTNDTGIYPILHGIANDEMSSYNWKESSMYQLCAGGNSISLRGINASNETVSLIPVEWQRIKIERDKDTKKLIYIIDSKNKYNRNDVFHVPGPSINGVVGMSILEYAAQSIRLGLSYEKFGNNFYKNGVLPSGVFEMTGHLKEGAEQVFRESLKKEYAGLKNAGTPILLEDGLKFSPLTMKLVDAEFLSSKKFQIEDICRFCRVPLHLVQNLDRCLAGNTLVYTKNGPIEIKDINVGEFVWSPNGDGMVLRKVLNKWNNGKAEILEIKTTNRTIKCNSNHRLLVRRPVNRELIPGETGGKNIDGKKYRIVWENQYIPAGELAKGDILITLKSIPDEEIISAPNGRNISNGFMEFCGLLLADGNINRQNGIPSGVSIARASTALYMDYYRKIITEEFRSFVGGNGKGDQSLVPTTSVTLQEGTRYTRFSSVLAGKELVDLGFSGTAHTKRIPKWVYGLKNELKLSFLRGFLDGDGTVDNRGKITFYSVNKLLINDLRCLCMALNIPVTNITAYKNTKPAPGSTVLIQSLIWRFTCSNPDANKKIGSHDPRYIKRFLNGKPFLKKDRKYPRSGGLCFKSDYLSIAKICKISKCKPELVYDIEVDGSHCFIADGVVSHNSTNNNIEHQSLEFVMYTMLPHFKRYEECINTQLLTSLWRERGYYFEFDMNTLVRGDMKSRMESYGHARQWGFMSVNDIRRLENQPRIPNGDIYLQPSNMIEAGKVVEQPSNGVPIDQKIKDEIEMIVNLPRK